VKGHSPRDRYLENDRRSITTEQLHAFILQQSLTDHLVKLGSVLKVTIKRFDQTRPRDGRRRTPRGGQWYAKSVSNLLAPHLLNYLGYSWIDRGVNLEEGMRRWPSSSSAE
jgi:hypothetical protein